MPSISVSLEQGAPILSVLIHHSTPRIQIAIAQNVPVPPPVLGRFLIDTGASMTCVDPDLIVPLQLPVVGQVPISTPSTNGQQHLCDQFDCSLYIPDASGAGGFHIPALPILGTHLKSQGIDGLIGRDVLSRCTLIVIGSAQIVSLGY